MTELKARISGNGNIKLGKTMGSFSKLYGDLTHETKYGPVVGTCGKHCEACKNEKGGFNCYVPKSYRYPSVVNGHARNTIAFREDLNKAFNDIDGQLTRKRYPFDVIRINQSGEIETAMELLKWILLARKHTESNFYLYTKNFEAVRTAVNSEIEIPENITILISLWHEYGIKEFKEFEKYPFIKAFAYDDMTFNYKEHGINIETYCHAYDENGKLDHRITCDKCKKCFNKTTKTIGCYAH